MATSDNGGIIEWNIASEDLIYTEVKYTNVAGEEVLLEMDANQNALDCPGAKPGGTVEFRSAYLPEEKMY